MACSNSCNNEVTHRTCSSGYVYIIVLYILLAIIIGSFITY